VLACWPVVSLDGAAGTLFSTVPQAHASSRASTSLQGSLTSLATVIGYRLATYWEQAIRRGTMRLRTVIIAAAGAATMASTALVPQVASASSSGPSWGCTNEGSVSTAAPGVGNATTRQAEYGGQNAGSVTLVQPSLHTLQLQSESTASGWVFRADGTGVPVRVQFTLQDNTQLRFVYRLNAAGTRLATVTVDCVYTP
jgi:hypothetical protein